MAFLDNSGDIILDAVLTDTGRYRLAKGDGSFKITKFALGDDEINYGSYDKDSLSGSAYYDLQILQTPILEAFTNNTSTMKSKLISIPRTNLLYLPVCKLSGMGIAATFTSSSVAVGAQGDQYAGTFVVAVDQSTAGQQGVATGLLELQSANTEGSAQTATRGVLDGYDPFPSTAYIRADQGLDTTEISPDYSIDSDLLETQYIVEMDNRFGTIVTAPAGSGAGANRSANVSFIDDDNIASYYLSRNTDADFVRSITSQEANSSTIRGPRGTTIAFRIQASTDLQTSTYLFEQLGETTYMFDATGTGTPLPLRYIDTIIKITGATTGYTIDIPVRYVKKIV